MTSDKEPEQVADVILSTEMTDEELARIVDVAHSMRALVEPFHKMMAQSPSLGCPDCGRPAPLHWHWCARAPREGT